MQGINVTSKWLKSLHRCLVETPRVRAWKPRSRGKEAVQCQGGSVNSQLPAVLHCGRIGHASYDVPCPAVLDPQCFNVESGNLDAASPRDQGVLQPLVFCKVKKQHNEKHVVVLKLFT